MAYITVLADRDLRSSVNTRRACSRVHQMRAVLWGRPFAFGQPTCAAVRSGRRPRPIIDRPHFIYRLQKSQMAISFPHNSVLSFYNNLSDLCRSFVSSSEVIANLDNHPSADGTHSLAIDATTSPELSFASHQNAVPVLRDLRILNLRTTVLENIKVEISADSAVFDTKQWQIDRILPGGEAHISKRALKLNAGLRIICLCRRIWFSGLSWPRP